MIAAWLLALVLQLRREKPAWPPLAICALLVLIKRVDYGDSLK